MEVPDITSLEGPLRGLLYLLPGLITCSIVRMLTVPDERTVFDRVLRAMLYTFLCHVFWQVSILFVAVGASLYGLCTDHLWLWQPAEPSPRATILGLAACGMVLGLVVTSAINTDWLVACLRRLVPTKRTSRPSEWYEMFYTTNNWLVLHLKDGRRVYGWAFLYPDTPSEGHLVLKGARWLHDTGDPPTYDHDLTIMIPVQLVEFIEFVSTRSSETDKEVDNGTEVSCTEGTQPASERHEQHSSSWGKSEAATGEAAAAAPAAANEAQQVAQGAND